MARIELERRDAASEHAPSPDGSETAAVSGAIREARHRLFAIGRPKEEKYLVDNVREAYDVWKTDVLPRFGFLVPGGFYRQQDTARLPDFDQMLRRQFSAQQIQAVLKMIEKGVLVGQLGLIVRPEFAANPASPKIDPHVNFQTTFSALVTAMNADQTRRGKPEVHVHESYGVIDPEALQHPIVAFYFSLAEMDPKAVLARWNQASETRRDRLGAYDDFAEKHGLRGDNRVSAAMTQLMDLYNGTHMALGDHGDMLPADPLRRVLDSYVPIAGSHRGAPRFDHVDAHVNDDTARLRSRVGDDVAFA